MVVGGSDFSIVAVRLAARSRHPAIQLHTWAEAMVTIGRVDFAVRILQSLHGSCPVA